MGYGTGGYGQGGYGNNFIKMVIAASKKRIKRSTIANMIYQKFYKK